MKIRPVVNRILTFLIFSLVMALPAVAASDGDLDTTFDTDGKVITPFGSYMSIGQSVAIQSDGKIVVAGISMLDASTGDFAVARYETDGSLDPTFGSGGKVTTSFGDIGRDQAWGVAIYKSGPNIGKIVVAGDTTASGLNVFALARYNTNGSLDTSFGGGTGMVTTSFALAGDINVTSQALSVAIQSDDRIVLAGNTVKGFNLSSGPQDSPANNGFNFALARYDADGNLDASFGGTGKVITDIGGFSFGGGDGAYSVVIQSDGKIVAAGYGNPLASGNSDFALVRYNTDGTLDTTFGVGGTGKVTTNFETNADYGFSAAIQSDGKIVVAGESTSDFALARYNTDGTLDTTAFGGGTGKVTTNFGGTDRGQSVAIQSDGGIVAAGYTDAGGTLDFALARYNANGSLDTSFDTDGKVTTDFGGGPDAGHSVAIQSDGKIVVAGSGGATDTDFAVARYGGTVPPSNSPSCGLTGVTSNNGATITYFFAGSLAEPFGSLAAGTPFTGSFSYVVPQTSLQNGQPAYRGDYRYQSFSLTFGSTTVTDSGTGVINLYDHGTYDLVGPFGPTTYPTDLFHLYTFNVTGSLGGLTLAPGAGIQLVLQDVTGTAWSSTALPGAGLTMADLSAGNATFIQLQSTQTGFPGTTTMARGPLLSCVSLNQLPVANAGPDQVVNEGATVQLDASASSDPENNPLTFDWTVASFTGPPITLSSSTVANPTFSALDDGVYTLLVVVTDGNGGVASDDVQVTVKNVAPAVNAGVDQSLPFGSVVNISASFNDPGAGDTWTYSINWGDGSPVVTGSATVGSPITGSHSYVVPGNQTITVCVTDDNADQGCDSLSVTFVGGIAKITGGALRFGNNGRGGFNVQSGDGVAVKGELEYHNGSVNLHAGTMTAIAVSPDLKQGRFAGVLDDGRTFVVYVEDNGEPGKNDIFRMWVNGVLLNGAGNLTGGNVQIHR
ncbi:MAG: PKD domain-containing protein [Opitutaceae bacterium]|nr:PKD domain-containing protein [Opitutaceae bacterium]